MTNEQAGGLLVSQEARHPVQFDDLYRDLILDHYRNPRNEGELDDPTVVVEGVNPSCGDEIQLGVKIADSKLDAIRFTGAGCSISQSSASMMTEETEGKDLDEVRELSAAVQEMLTHEDFDVDSVAMGDLEALQGVVRFPVRIKCALLAWKVLDQALAEVSGDKVEGDSDIQTRVAAS